jgi:hypothetical protein
VQKHFDAFRPTLYGAQIDCVTRLAVGRRAQNFMEKQIAEL